MAFPPSKAKKNSEPKTQVEREAPVSTGKGGIPNSLKLKKAGTSNAPGVEKNVNQF